MSASGVQKAIHLGLTLIMLTSFAIIGLSAANSTTFLGNLTAEQVIAVGLVSLFAFFGIAFDYIRPFMKKF